MTTNYETGPVNPDLPLELDDGTPVTLVSDAIGHLVVRLPAGHPIRRKSASNDSSVGGTWSYYTRSGLCCGGDADEFFVLRNVRPGIGHNGGPPLDDTLSLPDEDAVRGDFPMFDGLIAYFPNALAEVSKVSKIGNDQHNPGQPMHWARDKSTDHENKIARHLVDAGKLDGRGVRHSARLAWRALALLQEELERDEGLPPSRASRNRQW